MQSGWPETADGLGGIQLSFSPTRVTWKMETWLWVWHPEDCICQVIKPFHFGLLIIWVLFFPTFTYYVHATILVSYDVENFLCVYVTRSSRIVESFELM